jgi:hypothetical protein
MTADLLRRTLLWIFLLDTAFVIFNKLPPRLVIKEATMQMACPEACFQASTEADCFDQTQHWIGTGGHSLPMSVLTGVEMLRQSSVTPQNQFLLGYLGPLNLFVLTSGMSVSSISFEASLICVSASYLDLSGPALVRRPSADSHSTCSSELGSRVANL